MPLTGFVRTGGWNERGIEPQWDAALDLSAAAGLDDIGMLMREDGELRAHPGVLGGARVMLDSSSGSCAGADARRPWDARLARRLVLPLKGTPIAPNHLTSVRLLVGLLGAAALTRGTYGWANLGALLVVLSNFLDHTDGELARLSGRASRFGHLYDLASDAVVTIALFVAMGAGAAGAAGAVAVHLPLSITTLGTIAGCATALIFFLRLRIEARFGKTASRQAAFGGFETEDVLYLLPLVTLSNGTVPFLVAAAVGAPLFAIWVSIDYARRMSPEVAALGSHSKPRTR